MSRCKSCDRLLTGVELRMTHTTEDKVIFEDLCYVCRGAAKSQYNYDADHTYTLNNLGLYGGFQGS